MDLNDILSNVPALLSGILLTLELLGMAACCGLFGASLLTLLSFMHPFTKKMVDAYIFVIRGTPMLVQFYFIYYGLAELQWLHHTVLWDIIVSPIACSIIALTLNTSAYTSVILRGALSNVPRGELDAARAVGLSRLHIFTKIMFPRAREMFLPVYSNELLMLLKGTALASTITVLELTGITEQLIGETYQTILYWLIAGGIYLIMSSVIIGLFKMVESFTQIKQPKQRVPQPVIN